MSPKNRVLPLSFLCVKYISTILIQVLSDDEDEGRNYAVVARYLSEATYQVVEDLLKNILNSENLDAATRSSCLQVLLRHDVKKLETGIFPHSYYGTILKVVMQKGRGLQQLNLKGVWARDHPTLLRDLVANLGKLKVLIIPHIVDDLVLDAIISSCKSLNVLDISGECFYTVQSLMRLKSDTITILYLGNFGKTDISEQETSSFDVVGRVIENLPNLTQLRIYSFTGSAVLSLSDSYSTNFRTKLKYLHDTGTTVKIMESIINLCPQLESVHLDSPEVGVLMQLNRLRKINTLVLTKIEIDEVYDYLKVSGCNLQVIKLNHCKTSRFDLSTLSVFTPNLITLECYQMKLSFLNQSLYFMCLQSVEILYCDVRDSILRCVLTNSPLLKRMVVGCVVNMTDGDIFRICAQCDFTFLEELWFSHAKSLTSTSVELLMGHCPKLKILGQLDGWDIQQEQVSHLKNLISSTNTDLTFLPSHM